MASVDYFDPENAVSNDVAAYPLGHFSWMQKTAGGTFAYGLGVFTPAGFGARYDMINTGVDPTRANYEYMSFGALVRVLPAAAVQVTDRLSIGGTLGVAASHAEIEGPFVIQSGPFVTTPTLLDMQATGAALSWSLGVQYPLTDRTTIGAAYNSRNKFLFLRPRRRGRRQRHRGRRFQQQPDRSRRPLADAELHADLVSFSRLLVSPGRLSEIPAVMDGVPLPS